MTLVLSREQIRAYDRHAIERCAVPGLVLMENAGRGAAECIARLLPTEPSARSGAVLIVCGRRNNGGDGFVVGRHLLARGLAVQCFVAGKAAELQGDARANLAAYVGVGGLLRELDGPAALGELGDALRAARLVVDALFGTGLDRPIAGSTHDIIAAMNAHAAGPLVALDIPSGIDADTGQVLGIAVRAKHTITFARHKCGLLAGQGAEHAGEVHVVGLGVPDESIVAAVGHTAEVVEPAAVARALGRRPADAHKYQAGAVLIVAGRPGKVGAALLAGRAALRSGAGLVTIGTWPAAADSVDGQAAELMTARIDPSNLEQSLAEALHKRQAVAIGPGLGLDAQARTLVERVVLGFAGPAVVDADAISHFAGRPEALRAASGARVLTPHAGELARLLGLAATEVEANRFHYARSAALATGQVVVLKGRHTLIAGPDGALFVCTRGNAALATAGSGDVLTGMISALLCVAEPAAAACAGVFLHAAAADQWCDAHGADRGLVASDLIAAIPDLIGSVLG